MNSQNKIETTLASDSQGYQICNRCIVDTTVPGTKFDDEGICSYCRLQEYLESKYPLGEDGDRALQNSLEKIKRAGRGKKFDCVIGISGGRDSSFTLYNAKRVWGLRPLAVHFNDGFGNPVAGENMKKAADALNVELRTITSDWRETKDIRRAFLQSSTPDIGMATDIGIGSALYSTALKEGVKHILIGQSFRTEGIAPLEWNYLDGKYLYTVHNKFGSIKLRSWKPKEPGFHLAPSHLIYYSILKGIKTVPILYHVNYVRSEAEQLIKKELGWIYPGAHYYDDLYQSLMFYIQRVKFNIDRRRYNYSALIRSGQMKREDAVESLKQPYVIEDEKVINLCIKRLGMTREEFEEILKLPNKTFRDYQTSYNLIKFLKWPVFVFSKVGLLPTITYDKYFNCG